MVSKIIQKEKERQEILISIRESHRGKDGHKPGIEYCLLCENDWEFCKCKEIDKWNEKIQIHKQSLINLKEYLEDLVKDFDEGDSREDAENRGMEDEWDSMNQIKEDIEELNKMIERYE